MSLFRDMDVYKGIILASVLLIPASFGFAWWMDQRLVESETAIAAAVRRNSGDIEQIGTLRQNLETVKRNTEVGGELDQPRRYFERRILLTAESGLSSTDFSIGNQQRNAATKERAVDMELEIDFKRAGKPLPLSRDFIRKMLKNCETGGSQVWKLRQLKMRNVDFLESMKSRSKGAPKKTLEDDWLIEKLVFARRQPETGSR